MFAEVFNKVAQMNARLYILMIFLLVHVASYASVYFVAPNGYDANPGTKALPVQTLQRAQELVEAGDTVYIRGGTYIMQDSQIHSYGKIQAFVTLLNKSGTQNKRINYWAFASERPIFDFSQVKPVNYRVHAFEVTASWLHIKGLEVTGVQVTITTSNTQSICFANSGGSYNIYEQLSMHDGQGIGFYLTSGSNNLILNCDAYRNFDYTSQAGGGRNGGNVDGFGNHPAKGSVNNVFRGCRAWFNSDDGYDCISAFESTVFENCWAFYNGYTHDFVSRANGNGFKAGGYGARAFNALPSPIPRNTIRFCLAIMNKANGFYSNHHLQGSDWYNNTAFKNGANFNMLNRVAATEADYLKDGPGYGHVLRNNISFEPRSPNSHIVQVDSANCIIDHNTFMNPTLIATAADFISLDTALLTMPRKPDGSLPDITFMQLAPKSRLIDAGIDVGLPFGGKAPDMGCFETEKRR
jgi:hypothetical protein